uniref:hypothetical protein n=1 Tax=Aliarcobacter sp. TaxID=2321116 RepID=UPI00404849C6
MNENKLQEWINQVNKREKNEVVLFVDIECELLDKDLINILKNIRNIIEIIQPSYSSRYKYWDNVIIFKDNFKYDKSYLSSYSTNFRYDNSSSADDNFLDIINKCVNRGIIYIKNIDDFSKVLENLNDKNLAIDIEFTYISRDNFEDIIKNKQNIKSYVEKRKKDLFKIYNNILNHNFDYLDEHIELFEQKKILTAKFAHYLYRLIELDFSSTVSDVGTKIGKILGVRAKTTNYKKNFIITSTYEFRNFKAYDLNNIDFYYDFKMKIAKKLVKTDKISPSQIAKIVELPLSKVQKLWDNEYIN